MSTDDQVVAQRQRWSSDTSESAAWDARALVADLSKRGNHRLAIEFGDEARDRFPDFEPLGAALGWAYYRRDLSILNGQASREQRVKAKEAVDTIRVLTWGDPYNKYSPLPQAVLKLVGEIKQDWPKQALELLDLLDPAQLSAETSNDFTAPRARWYMARTKALKDTEKWPELEGACKAALAEPCLTKGDRRWVRIRRADALRHGPDPAAAIPMLEEEVARGREWWLYLKLALTYDAVGRPNDSLKAAYQALADGRDLSFRWEMAMLAGKLLQDLDPEAARDHVQLARRLRSDEGWPESRRLEELAVALELGAPDETASYVARLSKLWGQPTEQERRSGVVKVVLNAGSGFISPDDGSDDLYFGLPKGAKEEIPPAGTKVTFLVEQSYDHAKQRESLRATRVKRG